MDSYIFIYPSLLDLESFIFMFTILFFSQILVIENDVATVMGTKIIVDYQNVTLNHLTQANPSMLKKLVAVSQVSI